jgi:Domain of unknown function (DUF1902)
MIMKRTFYVKAIWDDEAKVWFSETDVAGLFIETKTLEEFEEVMPELARDMIIANHNTKSDFANKSPEDLFATITWIPPSQLPNAA